MDQDKWIVVYHVTGRLAGLRKIIGHTVVPVDAQYPARLDTADFASVEFVGARPRYVLYREVLTAYTNPIPAGPILNILKG